MEITQDYLDGSNVFTSILTTNEGRRLGVKEGNVKMEAEKRQREEKKREKDRDRFEDAMLIDLRMKEGTTRQGV